MICKIKEFKETKKLRNIIVELIEKLLFLLLYL